MAFPSVRSSTSSQHTSAGTTHTVNLPATIVSGDLLIILFGTPGNTLGSLSATGWTAPSPSSGTARMGFLYRVADGSEGSTVTVTTNSSEKSAHITYAVQNAGTFSAVANDTYFLSNAGSANANPDPPSISPSAGSGDYLWIAAENNAGTDTVSSYPANYGSDQLNQASGGTGGASTKCVIGAATRQLTATTEDPGTFTITASQLWCTATLSIPPGAPAAFVPEPNAPRSIAVARAATR